MAAFPEITSVPYNAPVKTTLKWKTLIQEYEDGLETRKQKRLYVRRDVNLVYQNISLAETRILWQFFNARAGAFEVFTFFFRGSDVYTGEYVGVGDGTTTVFNLPSKSAGSITLYNAGAAQTEGVDWTFTTGGGSDGEDKATFGSAPADGNILTYDFTGRLKISCRFMEDSMSIDAFYTKIHTTGIHLKGLLNR